MVGNQREHFYLHQLDIGEVKYFQEAEIQKHYGQINGLVKRSSSIKTIFVSYEEAFDVSRTANFGDLEQ